MLKMNEKIELIQKIANKKLTYNKDINQHIESCKISMNIIKEKDEEIRRLKEMLNRRNSAIRDLEEDNIRLSREKFIGIERKEIELLEIKEVLNEQYKLINDLLKKNG